MGSWNPRRLCGLVVFLGPPIKLWRFSSFVRLCGFVVFLGPPIKLWRFLKLCGLCGDLGSLQFGCGVVPQALCKGFGCRLEGYRLVEEVT